MIIKIGDYRIDEERIVGYYPAQFNTQIDIILLSDKDNKVNTLELHSVRARNAMLDALDKYFDVEEIEPDDENIIN